MLHRTQVETENRAAFLVQLHAVLGQVSRLCGGASLSAAQRSKLQPVRTLVTAWLNEVSAIAPPRLAVLPAAGEDASPASSSSNTASPPSASGVLAPAETEASLVLAGAVEVVEGITAASTIVPGRTVVDLVTLGQCLLSAEEAGLRAAGKGLVRLVLVRCMTTIVAVLRHILHYTYRAPSGDAREAEGAVVLARDVRLSVRAVVLCLETVTEAVNLDDVASLRFPLQTCIDTLRQLRAAMGRFGMDVAKMEAAVSQPASPPRDGVVPLTNKDDDDDSSVVVDDAGDGPLYDAAGRAAAVRRRWGPALVQALSLLGELVPPALGFVVRVASRADVGPTATSATAASSASNGSPGAVEGGELRREAQTALFELAVLTSGAAPATSSQTAMASCDERATLLPHLRFSFIADYLACVATMCGDATEGQLVATRIFSDAVHHLAHESPAVLRCCLTQPRWRTRWLEGALSCLVSLQRPVMQAGLAVLHDFVTTCVDVLGEDVGYVYLYGVFRLLESENCPAAVRRDILLHLMQTFLAPSAAQTSAWLLPHVYVRYDLNRQAYQVDLVQRLLATLAHLVRRASPAALGAEQHSAAPQKDDATFAAVAARTSLAGFAHYGLVSIAELLARDIAAHITNAPKATPIKEEKEVKGEGRTSRHSARDEDGEPGPIVEDVVDPASIRVLRARADKTAQARIAELFNTDPHRTLVRLFCLTAQELQPELTEPDTRPGPTQDNAVAGQVEVVEVEGQQESAATALPAPRGADDATPAAVRNGRGFTSTWDHRLLPAPRSAATAHKIDAIVDFLYHVSALRADVVAEYLSSPAVFPLQVCAAYLARLPLAGCSVTEALQILLVQLPLPREGQRIERLLEYFSAAYFAANQGPLVDRVVFPFEDDATCFVAVVATVMLNTDLHNPHAGARMTRESFLAQMRACVKSPYFTDDFAHEIFFRVQHHHLGMARPTRPTNTANNMGDKEDASAAASAMNINSLFISGTERRLLAFGLERQRILNETRDCLRDYHIGLMAQDVYSTEATLDGNSSSYGLATLRDLVESAWPTLSAVFALQRSESEGHTMVTTTTSNSSSSSAMQIWPEEVLQGCVRGLRALLYSAVVCGLTAEAEAALRALLRLGRDEERIRGRAWAAVLRTAASAASLHFSAACWTLVFSLVHSLRRGMQAPVAQRVSATTSQLALAQSEAVLTRVEYFTQRHCSTFTYCEEEVKRTVPETLYGRAVTRVLDGVLDSLAATPPHDGLGIAAGLALLKRVLTYSRIVHTDTTNDADDETSVGTCVNVSALRRQVLPRLVELIAVHEASDEVIQRLMECLVDLLGTLWCDSASVSDSVNDDGDNGAETSRSACYAVLFDCYSRQPRNAMVQMLVLQAVKELMARTWHMTENSFVPVSASYRENSKTTGNRSRMSVTISSTTTTPAALSPPLYEVLCIWRHVLRPVVHALARRESGAETSSLAVLVLRNLTLLSCRTAQARRLPLRYRRAWWTLLSSAAHIGALCRDLSGAQTCLTQLRTICAEALAEEEEDDGSDSNVEREGGTGQNQCAPASQENTAPPSSPTTTTTAIVPLLLLLRDLAAGLHLTRDFVSRHSLRLLILLAQSEHESLRADVMEALRSIAPQLRRGHFGLVAGVLARVVLQNTLECPTPAAAAVTSGSGTDGTRRASREECDAQSFALFDLAIAESVPRRCSSTAFRATLPLALNYLTSELLAAAASMTLSSSSSSHAAKQVDDKAPNASNERSHKCSSSDELSAVAGLVMERCLVPLIAANAAGPRHTNNTTTHTNGRTAVVAQTRYLAARSLMQCGLYCLNERRRNQASGNAVATIGANKENDFPLQCVLRCVGMVLYSAQRALPHIVPRTANFAGRRWRRNGKVAVDDEVAAYASAAEDYLVALIRTDAAAMADPTLAALYTAHAPDNESPASSSSSSSSVEERNSSTNSAALAAEDEPLVEYTTLLAQTVAVFPRLLAAMAGKEHEQRSLNNKNSVTCVESSTASRAMPLTLPAVSRRVMRRLLLHGASNLCAMLWRIAHPYAMQNWLTHSEAIHRSATTTIDNNSSETLTTPTSAVVWRRSTALLPHGAIRGLLHSYVELALSDSGGTSRAEELEKAEEYGNALVELLRVVRVVQATATRTTTLGTVALYEDEYDNDDDNSSSVTSEKKESGTFTHNMRAEAAALQRMSPQEQQHVRTCFVGMYQELSVVLATWLSRTVLHSALNAPCDMRSSGSGCVRRHGVLASRVVYESVVRLLSPLAGPVIDTAREYLLWHAAQQHETEDEVEEDKKKTNNVDGVIAEGDNAEGDDEHRETAVPYVSS